MSVRTPAEAMFEDKLRKAAREIRYEANGRRCVDCDYLHGDRCTRVVPQLIEWDVVIHTVTAVACKAWRAKCQRRKRGTRLRVIGG